MRMLYRVSRFLLPVVAVALFAANAQAAPNTSGVFFSWGGITHVTHPDGVTTGYTIDLGFPLLQNPATLGNMTVTATGPGFSRTFTDADLYTWQGESEIWQEFPSLSQGLYTFTLSDGQGHTATRTDLVTGATVMPVVDTSTLQRVRRSNGAYRFSWRPVASDKPYFYRLVIVDPQGNDVYSGNRKQEVFEDVPAGLLGDGVPYRARVEVHDAPSFDLLNNRSNSGWVAFTPQASEYDQNRLLFRYAMATNRVETNGSASVDFNFALFTQPGSTVTSVSSATITGPNGFSTAATLTADSQGNFRTNVTTPLATGAYTVSVVANGVTYVAYAALTPTVVLPVVDSATYQVADLGNGSVRFSWADANHTGPLYYRVQVQDSTNSNLYFNTARANRTYVDIPLTQLNTLGNRRWRVEVYDSASGTAVRNRRNSNYAQLVVPAFDQAAPAIDLCTVSSVTDHDGTSLTYFAGAAHSGGGSITNLGVGGPNALARNLLAGTGEIVEQGTPAAGLYTCSATDSSQKTAIRYNYQPAAHAVAPVDFRTVSVGTSPGGAPVITWAPVASDLPVWYEVEFLQLVQGGEVSQDMPGDLLSQTTYAIPDAMLQLPGLLIRINAHDGSNATTVNNSSMSVAFAYQGAGFDYASLTDADGDGYASNVNVGGSATLTVATGGTGTGSVHSAPAGISCASGSSAGCSASFAGSVTLTATPSTGSLFTGWQGACTNASGNCTVDMNGAANVTATFDLVPPVKVVAGSDSYFALLQSAYQAAPTASSILAREGEFAEALVCNRPVEVTLIGGYDASFGTVTGVTRLAGSLRVGAGTVRVRNVSVH